MNVNLLAISAGNTRTQLGLFIDNQLTRAERVPNEDLTGLASLMREMYQPLRELDDMAVYLASVNAPVAQEIVRAAREAMPGVEVEQIGHDVEVPIGLQLDREALVGIDRLLAAAGAFAHLKQSCIVVDAGTATTVNFIDGAGTFHGGAILPGAQLMLDSLNQRTHLLPAIKIAKPDEPLGHNTTQAMLSGVFYGTRGAVRELVEQYATFHGSYPKVVATGGAAELLFDGDPLIEAIVPDLTLYGMAACRLYALRQADEAE